MSIMSVRTVQTSFTTSFAPNPSILGSVDLNTPYTSGLVADPFSLPSPLEKELAGRARPFSGPSTRNRNSYSNGGMNLGNSRPGSKRYSQGLSSSYNQTQNQVRRASLSGSHSRSTRFTDGTAGAPLYQRTSRFDPFGDSKEPSLSPSPIITSHSSSSNSEPLYRHVFYYDPKTNRPTIAYPDDKNSVNATNLTTSTNILLDTLLNGRFDAPRSPSPPQVRAASSPNVTQSPPSTNPPQIRTRSPSPPQPARPRAAAISQPKSPISTPASASLGPARSPVVVSAPPTARPAVSKAQRDAIARVVANMLLNRSDGLTRRGRRCGGGGYVKSGLSSVIFVE